MLVLETVTCKIHFSGVHGTFAPIVFSPGTEHSSTWTVTRVNHGEVGDGLGSSFLFKDVSSKCIYGCFRK